MTNYVIDFDTLTVESKSKNKPLLEEYIDQYDLSLAVCIVDSPEELAVKFTINELHDLLSNIGHVGKCYEDKDEEADAVWEILEESEYDIPVFTKALGKKLVKAAGSEEPSGNKKPSTNSSPPVKTKKTNIRAKALEGITFCLGEKTPRKGTAFHVFTSIINDNLDQATFDELVSGFMENYKPSKTTKVVDDKCARSYLKDAFKAGCIEEIF